MIVKNHPKVDAELIPVSFHLQIRAVISPRVLVVNYLSSNGQEVSERYLGKFALQRRLPNAEGPFKNQK